MAAFRYTARDADGKAVVGQVEASSVEEARRLLEGRGLRAVEVRATETRAPGGERPGRLTADEAEQLTRHVSQLSAAQLPLVPGLRAAAEECGSRRIAAALQWIADQMEQGRSLEGALTAPGGLLPRHISGLILATARTGRMGEALLKLVEHQRLVRSLRHSIAGALAYPLLVVCMAAAVLVFVIGYVGGIFKEMFLDFDFALPTTTKWLFWCRDVGVWLAAGVLVIGLCAVFLVRLRAGSAGWQRLVAATPFAGQLWRWLGVAEWSSLLSVLIENQVPLPEALRLAADGIRNADLGQLSLRFAVGAEKGESLSAMLQATPQAPASLAPLIRWGEKTNMLAEALETGRQMFEKRVQARSLLLNAVLPPILLVVIGGFVLFVVGSLFSPMLDLIRGLSG